MVRRRSLCEAQRRDRMIHLNNQPTNKQKTKPPSPAKRSATRYEYSKYRKQQKKPFATHESSPPTSCYKGFFFMSLLRGLFTLSVCCAIAMLSFTETHYQMFASQFDVVDQGKLKWTSNQQQLFLYHAE